MAIQSVREKQLDRELREQATDTPPLTQTRLHEMMNGAPQQTPDERDLGAEDHSTPTPRSDWQVPSPGERGSAFKPIVRDRVLKQARNLPVSEMIDASTIPGKGVAEDATVPEAVKQGFAQGFTGGLAGGPTFDSGSPLAALEQVGEAAEASLSQPAGVAERMERFPELRDVVVPIGNAARFPELMETTPGQTDQQLEEDGALAR